MNPILSILLCALSFSVLAQTPISQPVRASGVPTVNADASRSSASETLLINIEEYIEGDGNDLSPNYVNNLTGKSSSVAYAKAFKENKFEVNIYPNPAFDWITVEVPNEEIGNYTFQLIDITGDVVVEFNAVSKPRIMFNTKAIHNGTYLVRIEEEASRYWSMYKLVKANSQ